MRIRYISQRRQQDTRWRVARIESSLSGTRSSESPGQVLGRNRHCFESKWHLLVCLVVVVASAEKVEAASAGWCVDCAVEADAEDD
jgi:hypothetical protein